MRYMVHWLPTGFPLFALISSHESSEGLYWLARNTPKFTTMFRLPKYSNNTLKLNDIWKILTVKWFQMIFRTLTFLCGVNVVVLFWWHEVILEQSKHILTQSKQVFPPTANQSYPSRLCGKQASVLYRQIHLGLHQAGGVIPMIARGFVYVIVEI